MNEWVPTWAYLKECARPSNVKLIKPLFRIGDSHRELIKEGSQDFQIFDSIGMQFDRVTIILTEVQERLQLDQLLSRCPIVSIKDVPLHQTQHIAHRTTMFCV